MTDAHVLIGILVSGLLVSSDPIGFLITVVGAYLSIVCAVKAFQCIAEGPEGFRHRREMWEIENGKAPIKRKECTP